MLRILFFARIRETLDTASLEYPFIDNETVQQCRERLVAEKGALWQQVLCAENVISAVNHDVVDGQRLLQDGDELAFYPPVTGG